MVDKWLRCCISESDQFICSASHHSLILVSFLKSHLFSINHFSYLCTMILLIFPQGHFEDGQDNMCSGQQISSTGIFVCHFSELHRQVFIDVIIVVVFTVWFERWRNRGGQMRSSSSCFPGGCRGLCWVGLKPRGWNSISVLTWVAGVQVFGPFSVFSRCIYWEMN